jgi:hypothetical protein
MGVSSHSAYQMLLWIKMRNLTRVHSINLKTGLTVNEKLANLSHKNRCVWESNLMLPKTEKFPHGQDNCKEHKTMDEMIYTVNPMCHMKTWSTFTRKWHRALWYHTNAW